MYNCVISPIPIFIEQTCHNITHISRVVNIHNYSYNSIAYQQVSHRRCATLLHIIVYSHLMGGSKDPSRL